MKLFEVARASIGADKLGLKPFLKDLEKEFSSFAKSQKGFLSQLSDYVLTGSGKRVRPALLYVSASFGKAKSDVVMKLATAVEMIHIATLIHDDLVDEAQMRRNKATVAVKFGNDAAVLLGDYVYARAFHIIASAGSNELMELFAKTTLLMCDGEIGQLERRYDFDLSEKDYIDFLDKKTASLMSAACVAGASAAGLGKAQIQALEKYGRAVGLAFQIIDDILDIEGEESLTGKTLRTDLTHGKMTLPLIFYRGKLAAKERQGLKDTLRSPNGHMKSLIDDIRAAGAIDYSRKRVETLIDEAQSAVKILPATPGRDLLLDMARQLATRSN